MWGQRALTGATEPQLGAVAIRAAVERPHIPLDSVEEVLMGCVLPAGQGQAPARQAALGAGLRFSAGATTVNKMCGSAMKAVMLAHDLLLAGSAKVAVAGGMESMSNAPHLLDRARLGYRMGHGNILDHMFFDGLEDAYDKGRLMGTFTGDCALAYHFSRAEQDEYAARSLTRAQKAMADGSSAAEIVPVTVKAGKIGVPNDGSLSLGWKTEQTVTQDETLLRANLEKIPTLKPFQLPTTLEGQSLC